MFWSKKAQAAVEYILIVAFALMLLVPGSIVFYRLSADSQDVLEVSKLTDTGHVMSSVANRLYTLGSAWETVDLVFPNSVSNMTVYNGSVSEMVLTYDLGTPSDVVFFFDFPIYNSTSNDCSLGCSVDITPGENRMRIESDFDGKVVFRLKG